MFDIAMDLLQLEGMKRPPQKLFAIGDSALLQRRKVSIVGSRRPTEYTRHVTSLLARQLALRGVCIVSGAAMGVDAIAHSAAGASNTIAVMGNGLDIRYPSINEGLIRSIEAQGLVLSQFEPGFEATRWSFVVRNELVAALGEMLIVTQADPKSGSLRSVAFAEKMGKKVYVLPQRIGESDGTNDLVASGRAEVIWDMEAFVDGFGLIHRESDDELIRFCRGRPTYEEAYARFGDALCSYELEGRVIVAAGRVLPAE